jgi:methylenetetrahydrofolate dehydrogenase (NADP+)/methenyltetrahydrofolate cyclohydrolase
VEVVPLSADAPQDMLEKTILSLNEDDAVHGILLFRPLPGHLSAARIKPIIAERKDVDCMGTANTAHVFGGTGKGYPPCTAQAVLELLDFYGIDVAGKKVTIIGRSLVVGKPLAMLLLGRNATVTICHTKTVDLAGECQKADILIACAGAAHMVTGGFVRPGQVVVDVGINMKDGKLCGDVDYDAVADKVEAITPVPGGIGTITTSVLLKHTIQSAVDLSKERCGEKNIHGIAHS